MANSDFRKDPENDQTKNQMIGSLIKATLLGTLATAAFMGAVAVSVAFFPVGILGGIALAVGGVFAGIASFKSSVDYKAGIGKITAHETGKEVVKQIAKAQGMNYEPEQAQTVASAKQQQSWVDRSQATGAGRSIS